MWPVSCASSLMRNTPFTAEAYCNRDWDFPYKIDHEDLCFKLFTEAGFEWGGDWTTRKDYQHFEIIDK